MEGLFWWGWVGWEVLGYNETSTYSSLGKTLPLPRPAGWLTSPVRRWMISKQCLRMRTAISFLPLLRPCIISEFVTRSTMGHYTIHTHTHTTHRCIHRHIHTHTDAFTCKCTQTHRNKRTHTQTHNKGIIMSTQY